MKKLILSVLLFLIIGSCKKIGEGYVSGTLLEEGTGLSVANAKIIFSSERGRDVGLWNNIDSTFSDNNGNFKFNFKKERNASYKLILSEKDHWPEELVVVHPNTNKKSDHTIYVNPIAYLKVRVRKTSPSRKTITILNHFYVATGSDSPYDTTLSKPVKIIGNGSFNVFWQINHESSSQQGNSTYSKNVWVGKGDTLLYTIEFN